MKAKATAGDFAPAEAIPCTTCGERPASHEITITARRGFDYQSSKQLFHCSYAVCEVCARDIVTVKLGAELRAARQR